ncbi:MAG: hypothetical protein GY801_22060 [bacterium]|nr:hypothetical protein [bacterium]
MDILLIASGAAYSLYERAENSRGQVSLYVSTLPAKDQKQVIALFQFIIEHGLPMNKEKFRHIGDRVYELKTRGGIRILGFFGAPLLQNAFILTHGLRKPKQKILMREKEKTLNWQTTYFRTARAANNFNIITEET